MAAAQSAAAAPPALDLAKWEGEIRAFEEADRQSPPPTGGIVFAGSSSIRLWTSVKDDFASLPVLNRGFGGSQIREVTAFADRIVIPYRPRLIVFYCGSNDVMAGRTVPEVVDDFKAYVASAQRRCGQSFTPRRFTRKDRRGVFVRRSGYAGGRRTCNSCDGAIGTTSRCRAGDCRMHERIAC